MRRKKKFRGLLLTAACLVLGLLITACGSYKQNTSTVEEVAVGSDINRDNDRAEAKEVADHVMEYRTEGYAFPDSIQLQFNQVEMTELVKVEVEKGWVQTKTVTFGSINGELVVLEVYKIPEDEFCGFDYERVVLLTHKNEKYRYQDCFSANVEDENREQNQALFRLNYEQREQGAQLIVHGAVELSANGPGRMAYYYYDADQGRWFGFEDWGYPEVADLDSDGNEELINQFPGLHMNWPDVTIYRWNNDGLSSAASVKNTLRVPNISNSSATLNDETYNIEVTAVTGHEPEAYITAKYFYNSGKLLRQQK